MILYSLTVISLSFFDNLKLVMKLLHPAYSPNLFFKQLDNILQEEVLNNEYILHFLNNLITFGFHGNYKNYLFRIMLSIYSYFSTLQKGHLSFS